RRPRRPSVPPHQQQDGPELRELGPPPPVLRRARPRRRRPAPLRPTPPGPPPPRERALHGVRALCPAARAPDGRDRRRLLARPSAPRDPRDGARLPLLGP